MDQAEFIRITLLIMSWGRVERVNESEVVGPIEKE